MSLDGEERSGTFQKPPTVPESSTSRPARFYACSQPLFAGVSAAVTFALTPTSQFLVCGKRMKNSRTHTDASTVPIKVASSRVSLAFLFNDIIEQDK